MTFADDVLLAVSLLGAGYVDGLAVQIGDRGDIKEVAVCGSVAVREEPGDLPGNGSPTVGGVRLPPGHAALDGLFWITDAWVKAPYQLWAQLAERFPETGLWPVIVASAPADRLDLGSTDSPPRSDEAEVLLSGWWQQLVADFNVDAPAYFDSSAQFPGLAAPQTACGLRGAELARQGPAEAELRVALVPVRRPSEVLVGIGWNGTEGSIESMEEIGVVLDSWQHRVGAYLVALAPNGFDIYIESPPVSEVDRLFPLAGVFGSPILRRLADWFSAPSAVNQSWPEEIDQLAGGELLVWSGPYQIDPCGTSAAVRRCFAWRHNASPAQTETLTP